MAYTGDRKREYQLKWVRDRKKKVEDFLGGCCKLCGSVEKLEVDHLTWADKHPDIVGKGFPYTWAWFRIEEELKKCQLLCKICHEEKTFKEKNAFTHGTRSMYAVHKCRCPSCKEWNTLNMQKKRHRQRFRAKITE